MIDTIVKVSDKFQFIIDHESPDFTLYPDQQLIAKDGSKEWTIDGEGFTVLFANPKVEPGHRAGLLAQMI